MPWFSYSTRPRFIALCALALCAAGCATINDLAPPVSAQTLSLAKSMGYDTQSVEQGRRLYLTACVRCHSPEAVTRYSWERWGEILPRMAERSGLNDSEQQALSAYIRTALVQQDTSE